MTINLDYTEFLESKRVGAKSSGFSAKRLNPNLFPFQKAIVKWALQLGRAAIFADTGLGKTLMQLAWADAIVRHAKGSVIILTPLAVAAQTIREAKRFGIKAVQAASQDDVQNTPQIVVTNYQKLHHFDADKFTGVVLDESSILKSFAGKTKRMLVDSFRNTHYRLACTATPAPNDHTELGNHSEFLGVMESSEMLSRWFQADQARAGAYRLKGHAAKDFWKWVASWSCCMSVPSDLGKEFSDDGYILPDLNVVDHCVSVNATDPTGVALWRAGRLTATGLHKELRLTANDRAKAVAETIGDDQGPWVVWCNTDYEADALADVIPDAIEIRGSHKESVKEQRIAEFSDGKIRVLISKPTVTGFGLNWQHWALTYLAHHDNH